MRAFISFMLVFISIAIILVILSSNSGIDLTKTIALKRLHAFELDIKNALLDLARQGALKGVKEYIVRKAAEAATGKPPNLNKQEMIESAKAAAHEEMKNIMKVADNKFFKTKVWCGYTSETELSQLGTKMLEGQDGVCINCFDIKDIQCADFIQIKIDDISKPEPKVSFWAGKQIDKTGVVGISIYSEKFNIADAGYIPVSEER